MEGIKMKWQAWIPKYGNHKGLFTNPKNFSVVYEKTQKVIFDCFLKKEAGLDADSTQSAHIILKTVYHWKKKKRKENGRTLKIVLTNSNKSYF